MNNKKVEDVPSFLLERHYANCELHCFELQTRPLAENDVHNRLILHERIRQLGMRGHEESVVFACLGGERVSDVARQYRISSQEVKRVLARTQRLLKQQGDKHENTRNRIS